MKRWEKILGASIIAYVFFIAAAIATKTEAIDYLKGIQQGDGSWLGDRESDEIATAKALIELCDYEEPTGSEIVNGVTWLKSRQSSKGWYGKTMSNETATAWAVEALQTCKDVDYIIHDFQVTFQGSLYEEGDPIFLKVLLIDAGNYSDFVTGATGNVSVWDYTFNVIVANQSMSEFGHGLYYYRNDTYHFSTGSYLAFVNMTYSNSSAYQMHSFNVKPRELNETAVYSEIDSVLANNFTSLLSEHEDTQDLLTGLDSNLASNQTEMFDLLNEINGSINRTENITINISAVVEGALTLGDLIAFGGVASAGSPFEYTNKYCVNSSHLYVEKTIETLENAVSTNYTSSVTRQCENGCSTTLSSCRPDDFTLLLYTAGIIIGLFILSLFLVTKGLLAISVIIIFFTISVILAAVLDIFTSTYRTMFLVFAFIELIVIVYAFTHREEESEFGDMSDE